MNQNIKIAQPLEKLDATQIAFQLAAMDVHFLYVENFNGAAAGVNSELLIFSLATSSESRLRLALIPLLLRHPNYSSNIQAVVRRLSFKNQVTLKCYYTAAYFLQQKYALRLEQLFGQFPPMPDLFADELGLPPHLEPKHGLEVLAEHHRQLSGRNINWHGTYEHGAKRFLASNEYRQSWQSSQQAKSTGS